MSSQALTGISYVVLKSGEHIIAFVNEVITNSTEDDFRGEEELPGGDPRRRTVGYNLTRACIVESEQTEKPKKGKGPKTTGFKVKLTPWLPLIKQESIPVPCDWVVTICRPVDNLVTMYKEDVGMTDNGLVEKGTNMNLPNNQEQTQSPPIKPEDIENGQDNQDSSTDESTDSNN